MRVMMIGDIVGKPGRDAVKTILPRLISEKGIDFVVANGENAAGGSGMTPSICDELLSSGVDVITSGDHIWKKREIVDYISVSDRVLRPLNYPQGVPGRGAAVVESRGGVRVGVINLVGRVFMEPVESPFRTGMEAAKWLKEKTPVILVDLHAEATSEKIAMGYYLDGIVSVLAGTHTHVQTADEKILTGKTAYITDCGMTGPFDGVIGRQKEQILARFITQMPTRFEMAEGDVRLNGVIVDVDEKTGFADSIRRVEIGL
ncbi:MAG: TIGR00282 family metallophosphoesterase [Candidatus Omnitrophota bacterium]